jgi:RNA polymerase sigma factor (TIGR02999 family)
VGDPKIDGVSLGPGEITVLLDSWRRGETEALKALVELSYPKLHGLAEAFLRREAPGQTLQATALVNELYVVLARQRKVGPNDREEFYSFAAYLIRLILCNRARDRKAAKRGSSPARVPLTEELAWIDAAGDDMLDLDAALEELKELDPRKVQLLELVAFLGYSIQEAAELAGISKRTADRAMRFTRAWLYDRIRRNISDSERDQYSPI